MQYRATTLHVNLSTEFRLSSTPIKHITQAKRNKKKTIHL